MIKFKRNEDTREWNLVFGKSGDTFIHAINDWKQLIGTLTGKAKYNWYTLNFLKVYFENDIVCPGIEVEIAFLGLGLRLRHNRSWEGTEIQERIDEVDELMEEEETEQESMRFKDDLISHLSSLVAGEGYTDFSRKWWDTHNCSLKDCYEAWWETTHEF